jgi:hypothetical protein
MKMASLLGIRVLCKAGCKVIFNDKKFQIIINDKVIPSWLQGPIKQPMDPIHLPRGAMDHPQIDEINPATTQPL